MTKRASQSHQATPSFSPRLGARSRWTLALGALLLCGAAGCAGGGEEPAPTSDSGNNAASNNSAANNDDNNTGAPKSCLDRDGDGFGRGPDCAGSDCDDFDDRKHDDCVACEDNDGDGFGEGPNCQGEDCDDDDRDVNPRAREIPGNGKDDDCQGGDQDCEDEDGDGYGEGDDCRGPDCDDGDRNVKPGAREICGNDKDDDCTGGDMACAADCVDADGDGYGDGEGCEGEDCDDENSAIHAGADEVCDREDNDCDGETDECAMDEQVCDPSRRVCVAGPGSACTEQRDCVMGATCQEGTCLGGDGVSCEQDSDCARGLRCDGTCEVDPNFNVCDSLACEDEGLQCLREQSRCVECTSHSDCSDWCAGFVCVNIQDRSFDGADPVPQVAQWVADCFRSASEDENVLCGIIDGTDLAQSVDKDAVGGWVCDDASGSDFSGGDADYEAAQAAFGCGLFDNEDIVWEDALESGTFLEFCMWTLPAGFVDDPDVVIDRCENFPAE